MRSLITYSLVILAVFFTAVFGKSIPSPTEEKLNSGHDNILLEIPVPEGVEGEELKMDGDSFLVDGKNFTGLEELGNILREERKGKIVPAAKTVTPEKIEIVVPVARNFSSLKELFEILKEDRVKPQTIDSNKEQTYVKGTENKDPGMSIFFTS